MEDLKKEIELIKERNKRAEMDKAWETSMMRKVLIAVITYVLISSFFIITKVDKPFLSALVPLTGYLLSTLSLQLFQKIWLKYFYRK